MDIKKVKAILEKMIVSEEKRLLDEPVLIFVDELEDHGVRMAALMWVATKDFFEVKWRLTEQIKVLFDEEEIEIPYPHMDVKIKGPILIEGTK